MGEIWTGKAVFPLTDSIAERLAVFARVVGLFSKSVVDRAGPCFTKYFKEEREGYSVVLTRTRVHDVIRDNKIRRLPALSVSFPPRYVTEFKLNTSAVLDNRQGSLDHLSGIPSRRTRSTAGRRWDCNALRTIGHSRSIAAVE